MDVEDIELLKKFILTRLTSSESSESRDKIFYTKRDDNGEKHHLYRREGHLYYKIEKIEIEKGLVKYEEQVIDASKKDILEDFIIKNQKVIIEKIEELETNITNLLKNPLLITHSFKELQNMKIIYETSQGSKLISLYYNTRADKLLYKIGISDIIPLPIVFTPIDTIYTLETLYECNNLLTKMIFDRTRDIFDRTPPANVNSRGLSRGLSGGKRIAPAASTAPTAPAYKLNGEKVSLLINKKKLHRSVYVRGNGNGKAKYCKINNEFVLLSKLKNKII
jgi:hypothetical protein